MTIDAELDKGTVLVVDDDASVREALSSLFRSVGWQVKAYASGADLLARPRPAAPACLVLDVRLPGTSGLELQRELRNRGNTLPVIFLTAHGDIRMGVQAMKAGAVEFLPKPFGEDELLQAVRHALARDDVAAAMSAQRDDIQRRATTLSSREREVMELIVAGNLNKQVAAALGIAEVTVKVHRRRVMRKMRAASLAELVRLNEQLLARLLPA